MRDTWYEQVEKLLGFRFEDRELLARAFRHSSAVSPRDRANSYEQLEFWGDKIIGYLLGQLIWSAIPRESRHESRLTQAFGRLSSRESLGEVGEELGLFPFIEFREGLVISSEMRHGVVADVYESVIAVIHDECGLEAARTFLGRTLTTQLRRVLSEPDLEDSKNRLWRLLQRGSSIPPTYKLIERRLPELPKSYVSAVYHEGSLLARGEGRTQKLSELDAASNALKVLAVPVPTRV